MAEEKSGQPRLASLVRTQVCSNGIKIQYILDSDLEKVLQEEPQRTVEEQHKYIVRALLAKDEADRSKAQPSDGDSSLKPPDDPD